MATNMENYGRLCAAAEVYAREPQAVFRGVDLHFPPSQRWKKVLETGTDKAASIALVKRLLPQVDLLPGRKRTPHDGIAEAYAMALWSMATYD